MIINEVLLNMERDALALFCHLVPDAAGVLMQQFRHSDLIAREFSNCGFFTSFSVKENAPKMPKKQMAISSVNGYIYGSGMTNYVGFVLFVNHGVIDFMECHQWDDSPLVEIIESYQLELGSC